MREILLLLLLSLFVVFAPGAWGQIEVTFTPQDSEEDKAIAKLVLQKIPKGKIVYAVSVCNKGSAFREVDVAWLMKAARNGDKPGFKAVSPLLVGSLIRQQRRQAWPFILTKFAKFGTLGLAGLDASVAIELGSTLSAALPILTSGADQLQDDLRQEQTNVTPPGFVFLSVPLVPGRCREQLMLGSEEPNLDAFSVTF